MRVMPVVDVMNLRLVGVGPDDRVRDAIVRMLAADVGSVAVCDGTRLVGIFTERDVLRLAGEGARLDDLKVADVMTTRLVTVSPDDDILAAARLMGEKRIRHLPVIQGENVLGILGIRDVLGALAETLWRTRDPVARETVHELLARGKR
jgi:CBS domain-containing protein